MNIYCIADIFFIEVFFNYLSVGYGEAFGGQRITFDSILGALMGKYSTEAPGLSEAMEFLDVTLISIEIKINTLFVLKSI